MNLALLAAGSVLLELVFGGWLRPSPLNRLNLVRNLERVYDVSALYAATPAEILYTRDEWGLRGHYGGDPSRIEMLTVGGSTTDQRAIGDGHTWQDVLGRELAAAGRPIVIANAGVDGQSTVGHLRNFAWWFPEVPGLRPRFVLFYIGINDYFIEDQSRYDGSEPKAQSLREVLSEKSALWFVARTLRGVFLAQARYPLGHKQGVLEGLTWTTVGLHSDYSFAEARVVAFGQRVQRLCRATRELGAVPLFASQPTSLSRLSAAGVAGVEKTHSYGALRMNGVDYFRVRRLLDLEMARVATQEGALFLDLAIQPDWEKGDFYDYFHMTPQGAARLGRVLRRELLAAAPDFPALTAFARR